MAEHKEPTSSIHNISKQPADNTVTLRIPKPNIQVVVLGLVAFITLFQTVQLVRISGSTNTASIKAASATTTNTGGSSSGADAPQSQVGGC